MVKGRGETAIKEQLAKLLAKHSGLEEEKILEMIEVPPDTGMGDYAFPCFSLAKTLKMAPINIAIDFKEKIDKGIKQKKIRFLSNVYAVNGYLNVKVDREAYAKEVLSLEPDFRKTKTKIMVEFSQPNTHKEFHVGHLRNASLGNSIVKILRFTGNEVIAANYIGDIGTHVAKTLWCLKKFHSKDKPEKSAENRGKYLGRLYAEAAQKVEEDEAYGKEVSEVLQKLEAREPEMTKLWQETRAWSIEEFKNIYRDLGIKFDAWFFESEEEEEGRKIALELLEKGIAVRNEGAVIVNLEDKDLGVALILKSDGTTLYLTKDLSLAQKKFRKYGIDRSIYVVDSRQTLHLQQAFSILKIMGFEKDMVHVSYEFVSTKEGPVSSRKGNVYLYEDLKQRMAKNLVAETAKRHPSWSKKKIEETADIIADSALKFGMLKIDNNKEILFDENEWLDLEGETGPYILYACARINSILRKAKSGKQGAGKASLSLLKTNEDVVLLRLLAEEKNVIGEAANSCKPSLIARYVLDLAQEANEYYHKNKIIQEDKKLQAARLRLLKRINETLERCLGLLGITALEEM